jgi:hypothetical protein
LSEPFVPPSVAFTSSVLVVVDFVRWCIGKQFVC